MVSRRALLVGVAGTAAVAVGATVAAGRADDVLQAAGVRPTPLPAGPDVAAAVTARAQADALVSLAERHAADDAVTAALRGQAAGLPSTDQTVDLGTESLLDACRAVADAREEACQAAVSTDLAVVLASSAAGLHQVIATLEGSS